MRYLIYDSNSLSHHGILGQKWGIRRYQNKDGSLTEAGKKRLASKYKKMAESDKGVFGADTRYRAPVKDTHIKKILLSYADDFRDLNKREDDLLDEIKEIRINFSTSKEFESIVSDFVKNGGTKYGRFYPGIDKNNILSMFREDFAYEGGLDSQSVEDVWRKSNSKSYKQYSDAYDRLFKVYDERMNLAKRCVNDLVGEYGNIPYNDPSFEQLNLGPKLLSESLASIFSREARILF